MRSSSAFVNDVLVNKGRTFASVPQPKMNLYIIWKKNSRYTAFFKINLSLIFANSKNLNKAFVDQSIISMLAKLKYH